jgi:exodeoxyribonuclease-5
VTLQFTDEQNRAIDRIVEWYGEPEQMELYVAGYAGVGKSTCVAEAIRRIKDKYGIKHVRTAAYTGKAAHVLKKKGNDGAQTIHSLIYKCVPEYDEKGQETGGFKFVRNENIVADLVVLDEVSMVSNEICEDLRRYKIKCIVLGDPGQLPPINGEGAFTNREPDIFLKEIHRQALDSPILELATMARQGIHLPMGYSKDGVKVLPLTTETEEYLHNPETQVLCGLNRIRWKVTQIMRTRLGYTEQFPMAGERIICCKNNNQKGLFNGAMGELKKIEKANSCAYKITADIEGVLHKNLMVDPYMFRQHFESDPQKADWKKKWELFDHGWVLSVHKAQGSGFPHVTLLENSDSFRENKWKHLYTAITRSESGLIILV